MIFLKLRSGHNRIEFDCGVQSVNRYLQHSAGQQMDKGLALTYVLLEDEASPEIVGFYTLLMSSVSCEIVPARRLPSRGIAPVILLAQFGVDVRYQGQGYGKDLLYHALLMSKQAADRVGCLAVVLNAVDEKARSFYEALGFRQLSDDPLHLWLAMATIREMVAEENA